MSRFSDVDKSIIARGVVYAVAAIVIVVGMFLGLVDGEEGSAWLDRLPEVAGLVGVVLAGSNLHRGSNSRVTEGDVEAVVGAVPATSGPGVGEVHDVVVEAVREALGADDEVVEDDMTGSVFPGGDEV